MNIGFDGLDVPEGKTKYDDPIVKALTEKFQPEKVSPYYFKFMQGDYVQADAIAITGETILDLLILDMDSLNSRLGRISDEWEQELLSRCIEHLETESPLYDMDLAEEEKKHMRALNALSMKPVVVFDHAPSDTNRICEAILHKSGRMFFYTAGKQEVHAWLVDKGATAVECAEKIHSDLARGFIRAELISFETLLKTHNMQSARKEGLIQLVERDYPVPENTVLEIRFNV